MVATSELINAAKLARRMTTKAFDTEVERLLNAAFLDLGVAGVDLPDTLDPLVTQAAITYFLVNFGEPDNYDKLKASYDEQKAQLATHTGHTTWSTDTEEAEVDTYTIELDAQLGVASDPAEIIAAYESGATFKVVYGNTVMYATATDYTSGTLTVSFQSGAVFYTLTATESTATFTAAGVYTEG